MNVDLGGIAVCIGMPVYGRIPPHTTLSLARTALACGAGGIKLSIVIEARGIVTWARDAVLDSFLKTDAQKLFWIDSDVAWEPETFLRLLAISTLRDVVCGSYPSKTDVPTFQINGTGGPEANDGLGLIPINGVGLGFTVMDRVVCEALVKNATRSYDESLKRELPDVFGLPIRNGVRTGEDIAFFLDVAKAGFKAWLDPTLTLGHVGDKMWTGRAIDTLERIDHAEG